MAGVGQVLHVPLGVFRYALEIVAELASVAQQNHGQRLKVTDLRVHHGLPEELELEWKVGEKRIVVSIPYDDGPDYYVQAFGPDIREIEARMGTRLSTGATLNDAEFTELVEWLLT